MAKTTAAYRAARRQYMLGTSDDVQVFSTQHGGPSSGCCAWCDPSLRDGPRGEAWRREQLERDADRYADRPLDEPGD